jgi:hypothetical protein
MNEELKIDYEKIRERIDVIKRRKKALSSESLSEEMISLSHDIDWMANLIEEILLPSL